MKRLISFGSIGQFRNTIKDVGHVTQYRGWDEENNEAIMDRTAEMPVIQATASEKVHGTNGGVCYSNEDGLWVQSKNNIITKENDNAGCAAFVYGDDKNPGTHAEWMKIILLLADTYDINLDENIISVFFEWSGGNIQDKSAVSGLDKRAIIFQHFKVSPLEKHVDDSGKEVQAYWKETYRLGTGWLADRDVGIYNIMQYSTWTFDIDFKAPLLSQNDLIKLVEETIEPNSPLGKSFGIDGNIGEGVVVTFEYKGEIFRFKVKGDKHSKSKVKTLKPVDNVKEQAKIDFANYATPAWRLEQAVQEVCDTRNGGKPDIKDMGNVIKWVMGDIVKEESDELEERDLTMKEISKYTSNIIRKWYQELLDKEAGL